MITSQVQKKDLIKNNQEKISGLLQSLKPEMMKCIPKHLSVDRMCRLAMTEFRKTPLLMECDPMSFISSVMLATQLGLEIGVLGMAYLVPFNNRKTGKVECQFMPGYQGFIELAYRSGKVSKISAEIVYENEYFEYERGVNERIIHKPLLRDKGKMTAVYAIAKLTNGEHIFWPMSKEDIDEVKSKAKSQNIWVSDYEAMARKTAIRRLFKFLPKSAEMQTAMVVDEHADIGIQDIRSVLREDISPKIIGDCIEYDDQEDVSKETGEIKSQADELANKLG